MLRWLSSVTRENELFRKKSKVAQFERKTREICLRYQDNVYCRRINIPKSNDAIHAKGGKKFGMPIVK